MTDMEDTPYGWRERHAWRMAERREEHLAYEKREAERKALIEKIDFSLIMISLIVVSFSAWANGLLKD